MSDRWDPDEGHERSSDIAALAKRLEPGSVILDAGCGGGRNALYLARLGFRVDAVDLSRAAIEELERVAGNEALQLHAYVDDVRRFEPRTTYDLIICHGVLHFLNRRDCHRLVRKFKACTSDGGRNALSVFTDATEVPPDLRGVVRTVFKAGELRSLYQGWEAESEQTYVLPDEHPGGVRHVHGIEKIVVRKPR